MEDSAGSARAPAHHLLVCFERGPIVYLQLLTSCWPASCSLDSYALCTEYLLWQQLEAAVQHVLSLNWNKVVTIEDEDNILRCFIRLVNGLLLHSSPAADNLLERVVTRVLDALKGQDSLVEPVYDAARRCCRAMLRRKRAHLAASYALRLQDMDLLVELILHARKQNDDGLVTQATAVLDCLRDEFSSSSSTSSRTSSSSYTTSASSCSTCDDTHSSPSAPAQELSNLNIGNKRHYILWIFVFKLIKCNSLWLWNHHRWRHQGGPRSRHQFRSSLIEFRYVVLKLSVFFPQRLPAAQTNPFGIFQNSSRACNYTASDSAVNIKNTSNWKMLQEVEQFTNRSPELPSTVDNPWFPLPRSSGSAVIATERPIKSLTFKYLSMSLKEALPAWSATTLPRSPRCCWQNIIEIYR